jgi:heat shock protein HslJ
MTRFAFAVSIALAASACDAADSPTPAPVAAPANEYRGIWQITAIDGVPPAGTPVSIGHPAKMSIDHAGIGYSVGCNSAGTKSVIDGDRIYAGWTLSTLKPCYGLLGDQERNISVLLHAAPKVVDEPGGIKLIGGGHSLSLKREADIPLPDEPYWPLLAGRRWNIASVDTMALPIRFQQDQHPLQFDATGWTATTPCGSLAGSFRQEGDQIVGATTSITKPKPCSADDKKADAAITALMQAKPHFVGAPYEMLLIGGGGHWLFADRSFEQRIIPLAGRWQIVSLDGRKPQGDKPLDVEFAGAGYNAATGCNGLNGMFLTNEARLYPYAFPSTEMGCGALTAQEQRMRELFANAPQIAAASGQDVALVDRKGALVLRPSGKAGAEQLAARPLGLASAKGRVLDVDGLSAQPHYTDPEIRFSMSANRFEILTPCGRVGGLVRRRRGETDYFTDSDSKETPKCTKAGRALAMHVRSVFSGVAQTITGPNGELLVAGHGHWLRASMER